MFPIRAILHPTDFSDQSRAAFDLACALARDHRASLHVLHVQPLAIAYGEGFYLPPVPAHREELRQRLEGFNPREPGLRFNCYLHEGDAATEIVEMAGTIPCDLIVMGTHGRSGLGRLLMGSVAEEVVRKANCPVVTVKTPFAPAAKTEAARPEQAVSVP